MSACRLSSFSPAFSPVRIAFAMCVEIITTGNELMSGLTRDSNFSWAAAKLSSFGIEVGRQSSVPDDLEDIVDSLSAASRRSKFVVVSGGLGPTEDDLSALAASRLLGSPLVFNREVYEHIRRVLESRGREPNRRHEKQAMLPEKATVIENAAGTASGFGFAFGRAKFYFLPGVPREFQAMFERSVLPEIRNLARGGDAVRVRTLRVFGLGESEVAEKLGEFSPEGVSVGYRIRLPEIHLRLSASGPDVGKTESLLRDAAAAAKLRLGDFVFSEDDGTLEEVVASLLLEKDLTLSLAESCTGGLCADRLTDVAGSSGCFMGAAVVYSNDSKRALLGVSDSVLREYGAVSSETVVEMARGAREVFGSDIGVSVSGIAGPGGGTPEKPVGTVWFGLSHASRGTFSEKRTFSGSRKEIKRAASSWAVDMVRKFCLDYVE